MCGITGIYNFKSGAPVCRTVLEEMTRAVAHRGPDAEGLYAEGPLGIGHRRLSILDLSDRGRQPMASQSRRYQIVFNGEIYNYVELRKDLIAKGYTFRTDTDTEVLLALFAEYGVDSLNLLNGMFAFAIWDCREQTLFLARDRVGIKPLYYSITSDGIVFASEVKALLASGQFKPQVAFSRLDAYFTFGYVPGAETLFQGCHKLLPGHWMLVRPDGIRSGCYWDVRYSPNLKRSVRQTADELRELLLDAIQIHLRSDVPVGVFLSGGLDSSATVALLAESGFKNLKTFSVAYDNGPSFDETKYARLVADRFQTDHHVLYMRPEKFLNFIPQYVWYMDEPVTEAAAISLYFISKELRQHVTVALSGEGADELFAGYDIYRYMEWIEGYRKLPHALRAGMIEPLMRWVGNDKLQKYSRLARLSLEERYLGVSLPGNSYKSTLYTSEFRDAVARNYSDPLKRYYDSTREYDVLSRMLYNDLKTWLVDDLLIKADKMTMANSVELRVPFLDYRIVEYAATIPSHMKRKGGNVKWILKQSLKDLLPREILSRKKTGFPTPLALLFQKDLSAYLHDLLLSRQCLNRSYFKRSAIENLIEQHVSKKRDHHEVLWKLVILEEWHRQFIDNPVPQQYQAALV